CCGGRRAVRGAHRRRANSAMHTTRTIHRGICVAQAGQQDHPRLTAAGNLANFVRGLLFTVQKALPLLSKGSSVILTGSIVSIKGFASCSVYNQCLTIAAGRTKASAKEFCEFHFERVKSRSALIRSYLDRRSQGARHPRQRVEPRIHRYTGPLPVH